MHKKLSRRIVAMLSVFAMLFVFVLQASALDDKYRFEDLQMSVRAPKDYYVITRESESSDPTFTVLKLGYDETMIAFQNSDIYLRAYDPEQIYWISVIVTTTDESKSINNYSDISASARKDILDNLKNDPSVESAVEVKHNDNIFFETDGKVSEGSRTLYIEQSNTIINGMQINLVLQKYDEAVLPEESKALTNMANSLEFDKINRTTGPIFEWWRLLLWVGILVGLAVTLSMLYKQRNEQYRRKLQERRQQHALAMAEKAGEELPEGEKVTFDEALGYENEEQFTDRAETDLDSYDISVREKNPQRGVAYFEDNGESIDDGTDYFDTYFKEPVETRSGLSRFFGMVGTHIKIALKHVGYFFKNLWRKIFKKKK
ncbi:MAG: hypothetical protein IJR57_05135 [Ruminococcus sp.]|nr:hypothetical protein [Ruminococcus sp.]